MTDNAARRPEISREQAQHFIDTARDAVTLRLEAGHHPEDAMMTGWTMLESWIATHVDGCACVFGRCPTHDKKATA